MSHTNRHTIISILLIVVAISVTFAPCLKNGFVNYDDDRYVYRNQMIRDLSWAGAVRIFATTDYTVLYTPLVYLSYACEYHFFNLDPWIYHLTNLLLHLGSCLLVFWFVLLLGRGVSVACLAALLFGLHPLRVESVAWVTERKDVLYSFFFLGGMVCYLYYRVLRTAHIYSLLVFLFILAVLSKPVALVLPFVLLLCDYYLGGRVTMDDARRMLPLFCIAAAAALFTLLNARAHLRDDFGFTATDYFFTANYAVLFYLWKTLCPAHLSCLYPHPLKTGVLLPPVFLASPILVFIMACAAARAARRTRAPVFAGLFFLITLAPALRLYPSGLIVVADRYTYLPSVGISFLIAVIFGWITARGSRLLAAAAYLVMGGVLVAFSWMTMQRCGVWSDNFALWDDAVRKGADAYVPVAYFNRGIVCTDLGNHAGAIADFHKALMLYCNKAGVPAPPGPPVSGGDYGAAYQSLAQGFAAMGKKSEAVGCLNAASRAGILPPQIAGPRGP